MADETVVGEAACPRCGAKSELRRKECEVNGVHLAKTEENCTACRFHLLRSYECEDEAAQELFSGELEQVKERVVPYLRALPTIFLPMTRQAVMATIIGMEATDFSLLYAMLAERRQRLEYELSLEVWRDAAQTDIAHRGGLAASMGDYYGNEAAAASRGREKTQADIADGYGQLLTLLREIEEGIVQ